MNIDRLDHLVLTVQNIEVTCEFYTKVLGMQVITFGQNRKALKFGQQKINLHQVGQEFEPKALHPTSGSADLCFITKIPMQQIIRHVRSCKVEILEDPIERTGATGKLLSIYLHDPDGNLIELSNDANSDSDLHRS
jgi:catechol 2,3-dioxygenase-like lactoylglutathione lyase family enzyme